MSPSKAALVASAERAAATARELHARHPDAITFQLSAIAGEVLKLARLAPDLEEAPAICPHYPNTRPQDCGRCVAAGLAR